MVNSSKNSILNRVTKFNLCFFFFFVFEKPLKNAFYSDLQTQIRKDFPSVSTRGSTHGATELSKQ